MDGEQTEAIRQPESVMQAVYHLSDQLDLIHQTIATDTQYSVWTFVLIALAVSFLAFLAGLQLAKGR